MWCTHLVQKTTRGFLVPVLWLYLAKQFSLLLKMEYCQIISLIAPSWHWFQFVDTDTCETYWYTILTGLKVWQFGFVFSTVCSVLLVCYSTWSLRASWRIAPCGSPSGTTTASDAMTSWERSPSTSITSALGTPLPSGTHSKRGYVPTVTYTSTSNQKELTQCFIVNMDTDKSFPWGFEWTYMIMLSLTVSQPLFNFG